jgi:RNA polymerase sigma-70 factor (ECF subfamily)
VIHDDKIVLDRFCWGIIRRKARQMVGRAGIKEQDHEDLVQELMLRLLRSLRLFDAAQADRKSFVTAVVERNAAKILRDRRAKKRNGGRVESLDVLLENLDEEPPDLAVDDHAAEQADLAIDVADLLARLPAELRDLAERLKTQTLSQVARDMGIPRSTLQRRVSRLRRHFEEAGLRNYR